MKLVLIQLIKIKQFIYLLALSLLFVSCSEQPKAKRVILIGIDGVSINGLMKASTPNIDKLIYSGAISLKTRAVMPTVSGPNWGSHILGAGPEQHGITSNGWTTNNHTVNPVIHDEEGYFPSIFQIIKEQLPESKTCFYYDWNSLANYYNLKNIDEVQFSKSFNETFEKATPWILENDPLFSFIYIGHPDEIGHAHKWESKEYIKAIEDVDKSLGVFFTELKQKGMFDNTHFIVVTDHGGDGYGHGGLSMGEIEIPWIISGPGVIEDRIIEQANDVFNTASTIAYLLELEQPYEWIGRTVLGAFVSEDNYSRLNSNGFVTNPEMSIKSGMYPEAQLVKVEVNDPKVKIRFTINGEEPNKNSKIYTNPILIKTSRKLKVASFRDAYKSQVQTLDYRRVQAIEKVALINPPSEKYSGSGAVTLIDYIIASNDYTDKNWLGFSGDDLEAMMEFEKVVPIQQISLSVLNNPYSWIFPPKEVKVFAAVNPKYYQEVGSLNEDDINRQIANGHKELLIKTKSIQAKYLKVIAKNMGTCPKGHPGEGEKAWMFVDEIIVE